MITDDILIKNGFILQQHEVDEYQKTFIEKRWYYGPYIYIVRNDWDDNLFIMYLDKTNNIHMNIISNKLRKLDTNYKDNIESIIALCKEWYQHIDKTYIKQIKDLEKERNKISKYIKI